MADKRHEGLIEKALEALFKEGAVLTIPIKDGFGVGVESVDDMLDAYAEIKENGIISY